MGRERVIVVIEDEPAIRRGIADALKMAGHTIVEAADGEAGLREARAAGVSLVLLDLLLPKLDGFEVLTDLRRSHPALPIIILSARGSENDRVRGLRLGADDYVVKPFSARELLARVDAVLRRSPDRPAPVVLLRGGGTTVDCGRREVRYADQPRAALSEMEASILKHLAAHGGRAVSREELLSTVWGIRDGVVETRAIDMHITRLRNKLMAGKADAPEWITTVRGKGYMLGAEVTVVVEDHASGEPR
ncbi:MAG TPA: response regulator transcription factor [Phycisphaerae bacterium]|nr:response regulator transcription factor [Phycisphaerae bacterium]HNU44961.1 response regulator transcription factor [Phycisphaerae bacterium]